MTIGAVYRFEIDLIRCAWPLQHPIPMMTSQTKRVGQLARDRTGARLSVLRSLLPGMCWSELCLPLNDIRKNFVPQQILAVCLSQSVWFFLIDSEP
jgi:hypothetical protein